MTQSCANRLQLASTNVTVPISGIGSTTMTSKRLIPIMISSRNGNYSAEITFHSLPSISTNLPTHYINMDKLSIPEVILQDLADPLFYNSSSIDSVVFYDLFNGDRFPISEHLAAHSIQLGWIVTGELFDFTNNHNVSVSSTFCSSALALFTTKNKVRIQEEQAAESNFISTFARDETGRFVVRLPFSQDPSVLGDSRLMAQKRFFNLERRFAKDKVLAQQYKEFMQEYLAMGHMQAVDVTCNFPTYYLPHHAVVKADSITTKVRVVFDGSAPTSSGLSHNDILNRGPKVHPDLIGIVLRFRIHAVVITADVAKMYRQVLVHQNDRNLQRIYYRESPDQPLQDYQLCTVTYGTKAVSFLATRCLLQLSLQTNDHVLKRTIAEDFYVDDL